MKKTLSLGCQVFIEKRARIKLVEVRLIFQHNLLDEDRSQLFHDHRFHFSQLMFEYFDDEHLELLHRDYRPRMKTIIENERMKEKSHFETNMMNCTGRIFFKKIFYRTFLS